MAGAARKRVAIFGATGSIGCSAIDVIVRHPLRFEVIALSAHQRIDQLVEQCRLLRPRYAVIADPQLATQLADALAIHAPETEALAGPEALDRIAASDEIDCVLAAIVGAAGLPSTLAAARAGKQVLLANKEAIVMAGPLLAAALLDGGGSLLPIDSEHNAVFQCLPAGYAGDPERHGVERIVLTASGGPFRGYTREDLKNITPAQACAHPNWRMGKKISVDSATLMNKGLEVIEAHWLFGLAPACIDVVVHRQSVIHALVVYRDGAMLAELGAPDMRTAIAHALAWPERIAAGVPAFDLIAQGRLDFEAPDRELFRALPLAYDALAAGGSAPAVLNAANEVAVNAFLAGTIEFLQIAQIVEQTLNAVPATLLPDIPAVVAADSLARQQARKLIKRVAR